MTSPIFQEIQGILGKVASWCSEAEIAFLLETNLSNSIGFKKERSLQRSVTSNYMLTAIKEGKLARLSWVRSDMQSISNFINQDTLNKAFHRGELATYELNSAHSLPFHELKPPSESLQRYEIELQNQVVQYYSILQKEWPSWEITTNFMACQQQFLLLNTKGLQGGYEHTVERRQFVLFNKETGQICSPYRFRSESPEDVLSLLQERVQMNNQNRLPYSLIQKGQSAVILSPWVVGTLCNILSNIAKPQAAKLSNIVSLPEAFELSDDPTIGVGFHGVPFDHEGTPTQKKILLKGSEIKNRLCDLKTAQKNGIAPSGNGFRRGSIMEPTADVLPASRPSYLYLSPGKTKLQDIYQQEKNFVVFDTFIVPMDRFQDFSKKGSMFFLLGRLFKDRKPISEVITRNYPNRSHIKASFETCSNFIDPTSILLSEGEFTHHGWFPYIFIPRVHWE